MRNIIVIGITVFGIALSSCSTLTSDKSSDAKSEIENKTLGLSSQQLLEGECGAFLWAETKPRQFVYFQKQDAPTAQFYSDGETQTISTSDVTSYLGDAPAIDLNYANASGDKIRIKGSFEGEIEGGSRIKPATIQVQPIDGWQQIIPVSGVYMCR